MGPGEEARQPPPPARPSCRLAPSLVGPGVGECPHFPDFFLLFQNCLKRTEWETGRDFTEAARAVFNGVVNKPLTGGAAGDGGPPLFLAEPR